MRSRIGIKIKQLWPFLLCLTILLASQAVAAEKMETIGGLSPEEALKAGEILYHKGLLPSGKPVIATVHGDLEITGTQSPCSSCHLYSGLGSYEGGVLTTPTNGAKLYAPLNTLLDIPGPFMNRAMFQFQRPAYTDDTLAKALILGIGPTGRTLGETMPRYLLDSNETDILIYYLKHLTSTISPGVNDDELRFSIIVSDRVSTEDREAMLKPLQAFFQYDWNSRLPLLQRQWNAKWLGGKEPTGLRYRKVLLDVWELTGPPEGWGKQLEKFYSDEPVFAILGGMVTDKWEPIHRFCEANKIPCIFPLTNLPVVSSKDWYTLYFSKGYYQEGETAAKYLSRVFALPEDAKVVQVYRQNDEGEALAGGFTETWKKLGTASVTNRVIKASEVTGKAFWRELASKHPGSVMLIWLLGNDLSGVETVMESGSKPATLFFSTTMLSGNFNAIPDKLRDISLITYPTRLPGDEEYTMSIFTNWMKMKKIPITSVDISSKMYFVSRILANALINIGTDFYRDFFIDIIDCGKDQPYASVTYPMLSFGPSQRYASKGCFVVTLTKGEKPNVVKQSDWVVY